MAPEVLAGGEVSPRSDVFGLAATLWTLVAGEPPRFAESTLLCEHADGVDRAVADAVRAALEPDPYLRLPSVDAFARALGEGLGPLQGAPLGLSVKRPSVAPRLLETIVSLGRRRLRGRRGVGRAARSCRRRTRLRGLVGRRRGGDRRRAPAARHGDRRCGARLRCAGGDPELPRRIRASRAHVAARTGYVPATMLVVPLRNGGAPFGILQVLDRRGGAAFGPGDVERASAFVKLALAALDARSGDTLSS